jgi:RNA polymerase sigma-54 factor
MGLGPGLHIRQAQTLVMSQQLQQAIKLLALSNMELEAVIAEELAKNPLLEARPGEGGASEGVIVREDRETGDEPSDPAGSDELIAALRGETEAPLDVDWR